MSRPFVGIDYGSELGSVTFGYRIMVDRKLDPKLERERSHDRSCINLSAVARNKERLADSAKAYVLEDERLIVCPTHVFAALRKQIPALEAP